MLTIGLMIEELMKAKGLNQTQLAKRLGKNPSAVNQWVKGHTAPSRETLPVLAEVLGVPVQKLLATLTGDLQADEPGVYVEGNIGSVKPNISEFYVQVPFLSAKAQAGFPRVSYEYCDLSWIEETYPVFMPLVAINERHIIIEIAGESMEPNIRSGALVLAENIIGNDWPYESGGVYAVLYGPGRFVVKRIKTNDMNTEGVLRLHSDNELHGIITVPANEVHCMWKVIRKVDEAIR